MGNGYYWSEAGSVKLLDLNAGPAGILCHDISFSTEHHVGTITSLSLAYRVREQGLFVHLFDASHGIIFCDQLQ